MFINHCIIFEHLLLSYHLKIYLAQYISYQFQIMRRQLELDDYQAPVLSFNVAYQANGGRQSTGTFTDEFKMKDMKIETIIRNSQKNDFSFQVNPSLILKQVEEDLQKSKVFTNLQNKQSQGEVDGETMKRADRFLRKISPLMEKELEENLPLYANFGKEKNDRFFMRDSRLAYTLQNLQDVSQQKLEVSCISWNASGVIIAAGYAKFQHETTCSHKSMVCLWGIFKRNFKPNHPQTIQIPNCVNCISFHPKKPSIFAVGTYIGQILLYDFSKTQEPLIGKTVVDDYFHKDCITKLSWWAYRPPGKQQTNYNILSLGSDGKILLWEVSNQILVEQGKNKQILKYPLKGFLMLRKKENVVIPVSGLTMCQSIINKNIFIVGSEGGSILRATLIQINHQSNNEGKVVLDMQQGLKFKPQVYPFLLNLLQKNLREIKSHLEKVCSLNKIDQVDSVATILSTRPEMRNLYPNPITFAYEPLSYPISSISYNKYGLFIANAGEGYSRIYAQQERQNLQSIEEGYEWGWINGGSKIAGFIQQEFVVVDWTNGDVLWSIGIGEGLVWTESSLGMIGVICDKTRVKILELGDKIIEQNDFTRQKVIKRIEELTSKEAK